MYGLLMVVEILISFVLIIVVLMQSSKGGGLAGTLGGGNMGAVFGVRRTADFLSKMTAYLAVIFVVIGLAINMFFLPSANKAGADSVIQRGMSREAPPAEMPQQQQPTSPATTPNQ